VGGSPDEVHGEVRGAPARDAHHRHPEPAAEPGDLLPNSAEADDPERGPPELFARDVLLELLLPDVRRMVHDPLRGGEEEGERMLREGDVVRPAVPAYGHGGREPLIWNVIDPRQRRLHEAQ